MDHPTSDAFTVKAAKVRTKVASAPAVVPAVVPAKRKRASSASGAPAPTVPRDAAVDNKAWIESLHDCCHILDLEPKTVPNNLNRTEFSRGGVRHGEVQKKYEALLNTFPADLSSRQRVQVAEFAGIYGRNDLK